MPPVVGSSHLGITRRRGQWPAYMGPPACPITTAVVKYTVVGEVVSGMDVVDKIKRGDKDKNGAVTDPDKIIKMQMASDAASRKN